MLNLRIPSGLSSDSLSKGRAVRNSPEIASNRKQSIGSKRRETIEINKNKFMRKEGKKYSK